MGIVCETSNRNKQSLPQRIQITLDLVVEAFGNLRGCYFVCELSDIDEHQILKTRKQNQLVREKNLEEHILHIVKWIHKINIT
jgi:hypothetical protein